MDNKRASVTIIVAINVKFFKKMTFFESIDPCNWSHLIIDSLILSMFVREIMDMLSTVIVYTAQCTPVFLYYGNSFKTIILQLW